ncbi:cytochrome P450 [Mycena olivaceomarginata]|nr:cytochrome P450 [Mycena olivaceomarginata]
MDYNSLAIFALVIVLLKFFHKLLGARQHPPFPPGPPPQLLVGNFRDLPTKLPWLTYTEWGLQYGNLVHANSLGQHIFIVNSVKTANELFEKRSHIYSDRPSRAASNSFSNHSQTCPSMEWDFNVGLMPLGDRWRQHRRMFQQHFRRDLSRNYRPVQMKKAHQLLRGLLESPQDFRELLKTVAAASIMATVYGYDVKPSNDRFVALSENAVQKLSESFFPGAVAVNTFPILRYLPSWMPGAGFQRFAAECRQITREMRQAPFDFVKQNITVSILGSFFLAMAVHPDVQNKAQIEIDTIVGPHRLPEFEDRPSLPFVEALFREVFRWRPVLPLGVAHATTADDIYNGYFIPKGATVISNIWAMTRDESIYSEPDRFNPDRFFTADGKLNSDDTVLSFGFDAIVWAAIVSVLSTFNIAPAKDANGNEIEIDANYSDGLVSHPRPFACSITPRSDTAKNLVQATEVSDM